MNTSTKLKRSNTLPVTIEPNVVERARAHRIKIAADGTRLPLDYAGTDHVAVEFPLLGLMYQVVSIGDADGNPVPWGETEAACQRAVMLGRDDWQPASRAEFEHIIDIKRRRPAVDTNYFPGLKPDWHWTRDDVSGSSASAWYVYLYYGGVYYLHRCSYGFALAVRRSGQ